MKRFVAHFPHLLAQWHPIKNEGLDRNHIRAWAKREVWWKCDFAHNHEWLADTSSQTDGRECPFCMGNHPLNTRNVALLYPHLESEWHPTLNVGCKPEEYKEASQKIFWWQCPNNPKHIWQAPIARRDYSGAGCPDCNRERLKRGVSPKTRTFNHPDQLELSAFLLPTKNRKDFITRVIRS